MENNNLNILFLPKWYPNELDPFDGNFIKNYAEAIVKKASVSVIFVHSKKQLSAPFEVKKQTDKNIKEVMVYFKKSTIPLAGKLINLLRYRKAQQLGFKELKNESFDLCHIHVLTRSSILALKLKNSIRLPYVISEHWSGYLKEVGGYSGTVKKLATQRVVKQASGIHTVSAYLKSAMERHHLKGNYTVLPNVVNTELFKPLPSASVGKIRMLYVGNLLQYPKQILDLIQITGTLSEKRKDFELHIYGEGKDEEECKKLIQKNNWNHVIQLKGTRNRQEIATVMAESDFLILYSSTENQPCVINEAQSCGLPVVVPNIAGIEERMNQQLGIVFEKNKPDNFAQSIINMLNRYTEYDKKYIRQFAVEEYSENRIAEKFITFYQKAIANAGE